MDRPNKHVARSEQTRARLVDAARELFSTRGYADVPIEDVVRRAGVTRGALYHQFPGGKVDLFAAVFDAVEGQLMTNIAAALEEAGAEDPVAGLRAGIGATLDATRDPELVRLTILDAPAVLGWEEWRAAGERYALGLVRAGLGAAMEAGAIARVPLDPLAQLLLAAIEEAIVYVARAEDGETARAETEVALNRLLDGLVGA
jgi:AcrR family transcriptional regulator